MKKENELEKLFRANQNKYSERPSPAAWKELSRRLESHRSHQRSSFNPMIAAATIIALVGTIALLMLFSDNKKSKQYANNRPIELKELPSVAPDAKVKIMMEFTREYHERLSNPLGD